jgi:hypothetical protein
MDSYNMPSGGKRPGTGRPPRAQRPGSDYRPKPFELLPEKVRNSLLSQSLSTKIELHPHSEFDYQGEVHALAKRITGEVSQINLLFPEYTPHDGPNHLHHLFEIADKVIGRNRYERLNAVELFILVAGLYAHDWGMAVSSSERERIAANPPRGEVPNGLLPDEGERLQAFLDEHNLTSNIILCEVGPWREYVRVTHAERSGVRVSQFFAEHASGVGEAIGRICNGHWLDFSYLRDDNLFPMNFSVLGERVNLRALAIYVRLVDLLDIANDRTPYAIWRFVAPRNIRSQMEWEKHRSLSPVTIDAYQGARQIVFDGQVSDPEVWAELQDLRDYIESQLVSCNGLLAEIPDSHYHLNLLHLNWRVVAKGFEKVDIRFEFDRLRMFEILSRQIYHGDRYVFLRELLQNSIDAIRMQRAVEARNPDSAQTSWIIYFDVKHADDGNVEVCCRDNGIGMDEYVIRNYFAVAGKSYYQSDDFKRLALHMDPIARFGIGILSCFLVADKIEIITRRNVQPKERSYPLRVVIPALDKRFRIFPVDQKSNGTSVKVFVQATKLKDEPSGHTVGRFKVTDYLKEIAGFVEFPIVITEDGEKTVILHPGNSIDADRRFGSNVRISQLSGEFPYQELFSPEDLAAAKCSLTTKKLDIGRDLKLNSEGFDGFFSILTPADPQAVLVAKSEELRIVNRGTLTPSQSFRFEGSSGYGRAPAPKVPSPSASQLTFLAVFSNGILVPWIETPKMSNGLVPFIKLNIVGKATSVVNLTRNELHTVGIEPYNKIWNALTAYIRDTKCDRLIAETPRERLFQIGVLILTYHLSQRNICDVISEEHHPLPYILPGGIIEVSNFDLRNTERLFASPATLGAEIAKLIDIEITHRQTYDGALKNWVGDRCLLVPGEELEGSICKSIRSLLLGVLWRNFERTNVRFLDAGPFRPALAQTVWERRIQEFKDDDNNDLVFLEEMCAQVTPFFQSAISRLWRVSKRTEVLWLRETLPFSAPFETAFAYGQRFFNSVHPTIYALIKSCAALALQDLRRSIPEAAVDKMRKALLEVRNDVWGLVNAPSLPESEKMETHLDTLWRLVRDFNLFDLPDDPPIPRRSDFVPYTCQNTEEAMGDKVPLGATLEHQASGL